MNSREDKVIVLKGHKVKILYQDVTNYNDYIFLNNYKMLFIKAKIVNI